jgi:hypothetical protein
MTRDKLNALKATALERKDKTTDMDVLIAALLALPPGQLKKVLSEDVLQVLSKYGYEKV